MKIFTGRVIHTKMAKTARVVVETVKFHPVYGKRIKSKKIFLVHDDIGVKDGQIVHFAAGKPISKRKKWTIVTPVQNKTKKEPKIKKSIKVKRQSKK